MEYRYGWKLHFQRKGSEVEWWVYNPAFGSRQGTNPTRGGARKEALFAIGDFVQGLA